MSKLVAIFLFVIFILICDVAVKIIEDKMKKGFLKAMANIAVAIVIIVVVLIFVNFVFGS